MEAKRWWWWWLGGRSYITSWRCPERLPIGDVFAVPLERVEILQRIQEVGVHVGGETVYAASNIKMIKKQCQSSLRDTRTTHCRIWAIVNTSVTRQLTGSNYRVTGTAKGRLT